MLYELWISAWVAPYWSSGVPGSISTPVIHFQCTLYAHSSFLLHLIFHLKHKGKLNVWCRKNNKYNMYIIIYQKLIQPFSVCLSVCHPPLVISLSNLQSQCLSFSIVDLISSIIIAYIKWNARSVSNSIMILTIKDLTYAL